LISIDCELQNKGEYQLWVYWCKKAPFIYFVLILVT